MNEICQLKCEDIWKEGDSDVLWVRKGKTPDARRAIPVHPMLAKLGLLEYAEAIRLRHGGHSALFPDIAASATGYASEAISKSLIRLVQSLGVTTRGGVAHRLRHTFRDALRDADISIDAVKALGVWKRKEVHGSYGSALRTATLASAIAKVTYPDLEFAVNLGSLRDCFEKEQANSFLHHIIENEQVLGS